MSDQMQIRRDTAANWAASAKVLAAGELGWATDVPNGFKIGTGALWGDTAWLGMGFTVWGETPAGDMDGTNDTYTLASAPAGTNVFGFYNTQPLVGGVDLTRSGATVTLATIRPNVADDDTLIIFC